MTTQGSFSVVHDLTEERLRGYLAEDVVAVDCEMQGLQLWRDNVCLVQICDSKGNVSLVQVKSHAPPPNLVKFLTDPGTTKVFHYALTDVCFLKASLDVGVHPYVCTKVMSKLARTYSESHSLKVLVHELVGIELDKTSQTTDWSRPDLTEAQLAYAASDVTNLLQVYHTLEKMLKDRGKLPSGITAEELNAKSQACLPAVVEIVLNGYGDRDRGWESSIFSH